MGAEHMHTCTLIKRSIRRGIGAPGIEELNGNPYCQGYQRSDADDEPCTKCIDCRWNISNQ